MKKIILIVLSFLSLVSCSKEQRKKLKEAQIAPTDDMFEDIVAEGNIVVIDNGWIVLCKWWKPEYQEV